MTERLLIEAPSDAQLDYIRSLCTERGYPMAAVHSKTEASIVIGELLNRTYGPPEWAQDEWLEANEHERIGA